MTTTRRSTLTDLRVAIAAGPIVLAAPLVARLPPEPMHRVLEAHLGQQRLACSDERVLQVIDLLMSRAPWSVRNRCLVRGITAYRVLRGAGRDVQLVFGARLVDGHLEAHCWLSDGDCVIHEHGPADPPFEEMFRLTPGGVVS